MGNGVGAPRMHSMMHLCLVRYTLIFCRPYTRCQSAALCQRTHIVDAHPDNLVNGWLKIEAL